MTRHPLARGSTRLMMRLTTVAVAAAMVPGLASAARADTARPSSARAIVAAMQPGWGMGNTYDEANAKPMPTGASGSIKAGMAHFATAQGATVVSVTSTGPFAMTYVNPSDDPTRALAKPKS